MIGSEPLSRACLVGTFLIGRDGTVVRRWDNVKVAGHAEAVLEAVGSL